MNNLKKIWNYLGQSIYVGERLEKNLRSCTFFGIIIAVISAIMTILNIVQHKGFVTFTTAAFFVMGIIISVSTGKFKNKNVAVLSVFFTSIFSFTYYAITGVNEGFAILWTLVVPVALCYFASVKFGILMLIYFEILIVILFYTPLRQFFVDKYDETFLNRFPILYLCAILTNILAMVQYHISTLKQMDTEQKLKEAAEAAQAADNAKSSFLAQMSHEIRTPINTVLGMNEMILRRTKDEDILNYAADIRTSGNTLLSLINSILDFSKIKDGKMELVSVEYETIDVIANLINSVSERARAKDLLFNINIDNILPSKMYGDDLRITQIIVNLLTNAVKYTESGHIDLNIQSKGITNDNINIFVSVSDTGIGIKEEDKLKLFESFERLDVTKNHNIEGTGLGMSIVTKLLSLMNSSLSLESTYGHGSVFSFTITQKIIDSKPIGDYKKALTEKSRTKDIKKLIYAPNAKILVVDDNSMNLKVAQGLLKLCGIKAEVADSGNKAIRLIRKNIYDIIFMDHMMPNMDGIETLKKCKEEGILNPKTKVIALTANAVIGAKEMYMDLGFDDYLSKPIETDELKSKLNYYLPPEAFEASASSTDTALPEKHINLSETFSNTVPAVDDNTEPVPDDDEILEFFPENEEDKTYHFFDIKSLKEFDIDTNAGLSYCAGDPDFYKELIRDYVNDNPSKVNELNNLFEAQSWGDYQIKVHALKSVSKTIGANQIFEKAKDLEFAAKENNIQYILDNHSELIETYNNLADNIKSIM